MPQFKLLILYKEKVTSFDFLGYENDGWFKPNISVVV